MSYFEFVRADTMEELMMVANDRMEELTPYRQPSIKSIEYVEKSMEKPGYWIAKIEYWGLD